MYYQLFTLSALTIAAFAQQNNGNANDTIKSKPEGLPDIDWTILNLDPSARENLCERQKSYCSSSCGGPQEAMKNFCNITTMGWGCDCASKKSNPLNFLWPIVHAECSGKAQACQMMCYQDKINPSACATLCNSYYLCGTDNAPPSYLETILPTDLPSYKGPKVEVKQNQTHNDTASIDRQNSGAKYSYHMDIIYNLVLLSVAMIYHLI
ncbi:hypothetical protein BDB01DRAFT_337799 [Pilobolus umbonatus]|nr:hypothetical protein BDB01DRAFT_337799 [Pilobolus umbonatus]